MKQFGDRVVLSHLSDEGSVSMHSVKAVYRYYDYLSRPVTF